MTDVDQNIERLIVRRLDGELTLEEQAVLDRALLKCPDTRALLEEYQRIDAAASAALASVVAAEDEAAARFVAVAPPGGRRAYSRAWWALPAAVAAVIALMVVFVTPEPEAPQLVQQETATTAAPARPALAPVPAPEGPAPVRHAAYGSNVDRSTDTNAIYILGPDGNIYVLEQQRVRTARIPTTGIRPASGDL